MFEQNIINELKNIRTVDNVDTVDNIIRRLNYLVNKGRESRETEDILMRGINCGAFTMVFLHEVGGDDYDV